MLVYRIEHPSDGKGPYSGRSDYEKEGVQDWLDGDFEELHQAHDPFSTPHPLVNEIDGFERGDLCGCESLDKLRDWFKGFLDSLHDCGFVVVTYEVPAEHVHTDGLQVCFSPAHGTKCKTESIAC
jgi:hypothetical protein